MAPPTILPVSPAGGDPLATVFLSRTGCGARLLGQEVDGVLEQFPDPVERFLSGFRNVRAFLSMP